MKFQNPEWRFESPGTLPDAAYYQFFNLAVSTAAQGRVQDILEDFKSRFAGGATSRSSTESWAETDLRGYMRDAAANAPVFIEAFVNACADIRDQGLDVPSIATINRILSQTNAGYRIEGDVIVSNWVAVDDASDVAGKASGVKAQPRSVIEGSYSKKTVVKPLKADVVVYGGGVAKPSRAEATALRAFLCHSSGDKPAIKALYDRLKGDEFDPWLDTVNLSQVRTGNSRSRKPSRTRTLSSYVCQELP